MNCVSGSEAEQVERTVKSSVETAAVSTNLNLKKKVQLHKAASQKTK